MIPYRHNVFLIETMSPPKPNRGQQQTKTEPPQRKYQSIQGEKLSRQKREKKREEARRRRRRANRCNINNSIISIIIISGRIIHMNMEQGIQNMEYGKEELYSYPIYCTQYFDSCCFPPYFHQLGVIWGGSIRRIKILYYKDWIVIIQYHNRNHNQIKSNRIYLDIWKWIYRLETDII